MSTQSRLVILAAAFAMAMGRVAMGQQPPGATGTALTTGQIAQTTFLPLSIPFDIHSGVIVVKANLGDGQQQDAALATGLPLCLIPPDIAAKQFVKTSGVHDVPCLYGKIQVSDADPQTLRIGSVVMMTAVPFGVFDLAHYLSAKAAPDAPALWIGNSALGAFAVTIDPAKHEIRFQKSNTPLPKKAVVVPFELKDGRIWVQAKANGKKTFSALIDTSAMGTLLPAGVARSLNLPAATTLVATQPNSKDGKEGKIGVIELHELAIGDAKANDVQALYCADESAAGIDNDLGVIGCDLLLRYKVTIHYGLHVIAFEKLPPPPVVKQSAPPGATPLPGPTQPIGQPTIPPIRP